MQRKAGHYSVQNRTESKYMKIKGKTVFVNPLEAAKLAMPFYGGVEDVNNESVANGSAGSSNSDNVDSGDTDAGDSSSGALSQSPEDIADLLKQLNDATKTIKDLQGKTANYEKEKANAVRAQQSREQQLETDLSEAQQIIAKMDSVIRHTAVVNAIQGMKDYQFHSAKHVLNELDTNAFDVDVDLENGTATVTGIESEIKRVAKEMPWLVAQAQNIGKANGSRSIGSSGAPPSNPNSDTAKVARRSELMKKFPVIAHGRAAR